MMSAPQFQDKEESWSKFVGVGVYLAKTEPFLSHREIHEERRSFSEYMSCLGVIRTI